MYTLIYSIENLRDLEKLSCLHNISKCYFKYYADFIQAKEKNLNAHLADELLNAIEREELQKLIYDFLANWHLDQNGKDYTDINGFSFARVFNGSFLILLVSFAQYAGIFTHLWQEARKKSDSVAICYESKKSLSFIVADFLNRSSDCKFDLLQCSAVDHAMGEDRFVLYKDYIFRKDKTLKNIYCELVRFAQRLFFNRPIYGKVLISSDWTNSWLGDYSHDLNCLVKGHNPVKAWVLKGFLPKMGDDTTEIIMNSFERMMDVLENRLTQNFLLFDIDLSQLFIQYVKEYLTSFKSEIVDYALKAWEAIDFYKPRAVVINYELAEKAKILASIARMNKIPVINLLDGYGTRLFFPFEKTDSAMLQRTYYSELCNKGKESLVRKGIESDKVFVMTAPVFAEILTRSDNTANRSSAFSDVCEFDVIIFGLVRNNYTVKNLWSSPEQYLFDGLEICKELGFKRVGIKLKNELMKNDSCKAIGEKFTDKLDIDFLTGSALDHYKKASIVIGGISTAMAEAALLGKKYYIFEPWNNGMADMDCPWQKKLSIAHNREELKFNIKNNLYFCRSNMEAKEYGIPVSENIRDIKNRIVSEFMKGSSDICMET